MLKEDNGSIIQGDTIWRYSAASQRLREMNVSITPILLKGAIEGNRLSHHRIHSLSASWRPAFVVNDTIGTTDIGPHPALADFYFNQQLDLGAVDGSRIKRGF